MSDEDDDDASELITSLATEVSNLREDCIEKEQIISQMEVWWIPYRRIALDRIEYENDCVPCPMIRVRIEPTTILNQMHHILVGTTSSSIVCCPLDTADVGSAKRRLSH